MEKNPPLSKIYEALSAVADQRIDIQADRAYVLSLRSRQTVHGQVFGKRLFQQRQRDAVAALSRISHSGCDDDSRPAEDP